MTEGSENRPSRSPGADHPEVENLFRTVCTVVPAAILIIQGEEMPFVNDAAAAVTGYTREEMRRMRFWDMVHPDYREIVRERGMARQRGERVPSSYEVPVIRKDGDVRWIEYTGSKFTYRDAPAVLGVGFDITERKRMEEELQRRIGLEQALSEISSRFVQCPFEDSGAIVEEALRQIGELFDVDRAFVYLFQDSSSGIARLEHCWVRPGTAGFGSFMKEVGPDGFPECYARLDRGESLQIDDLMESPYDRDRFRELHDEVRARSLIVVPIRYDPDERGSFGLCTHEKKASWNAYERNYLQVLGGIFVSALAGRDAREALRRSEERYRTLYDDNPSTYFTLAADGKVLSVNRFGADQLGYRVDQLAGRPVQRIVHPDDVPVLMRGLERAAAEPGELCHWELRKIDRDGGERWMKETVRAVGGGEGGTTFFVSCEDITEARRAIEEKRKLEAQLEYAQKMESVALLASVIAHEFNNQLMVIGTSAELAQLDLPEDSPVREPLEQIRATVESSGSLTAQLLAYAGRHLPEPDPLSLSRIVREMDRLLSVAFSGRAVIEFDIAETIPVVEGDGTKIRQVLMNLMTNAVDALEGRAGVVTVRTGRCRLDAGADRGEIFGADLADGEYAFLEVADTGGGVDASDRAKIFEPFHTTRKGGRGLGLFVVMEIVQGFGGGILVESDPGRGSVFRVLLPATDREISPPSRSRRSS